MAARGPEGRMPAGSRSVLLVGVPLDLYRRAGRHADDLFREVALIAPHTTDPLVAEAAGLFAAADRVRRELARQALAAAARGEDPVTFRLRLPVAAAAGIAAWGRVHDGLAALSARGVMLAVPPDPELVRFRQWYVDEIVAQLQAGTRPTPWGGDHGSATTGGPGGGAPGRRA